jgi:demethylspheroidene O-methyltransferase
LRDRLLASPGFRHWAARFPLTRPIARRRARALFDLCAGFVYSQVLLAWVRLDLSATLLEHPQSLESLATRVRLAPERARTLLDAAAALRLAARRGDGRYALGPLGAALIGNPGVGAMVEHHARLYADLADPMALLRQDRRDTALAGLWPYAHADDPAALGGEQVAAYSRLMAASQPLIAAETLDAYRFARHRCLLDLGGGEGAFLEAVAARWPHLRLMLFDLPAVAARAQARLGPRARCFGGDFRRDRLPEGADVIALVRVLHDHDDETVRYLLDAARRVLPEGGRLLIAEPMAGTRGAGPILEAYFGFYLLAMGRGRPRSAATLAGMLRAAGFRRVWGRPTALPVLSSVLVAEK